MLSLLTQTTTSRILQSSIKIKTKIRCLDIFGHHFFLLWRHCHCFHSLSVKISKTYLY